MQALPLDSAAAFLGRYIQWGYLTLFGAAFPACTLLACITNFTETRTDGRKLLTDFRRVIPHAADGIGEPLKMFRRTCYASVPVNAGLIMFTFKAPQRLGLAWVDNNPVYSFALLVCILGAAVRGAEAIWPAVSTKTQVRDPHQSHAGALVLLLTRVGGGGLVVPCQLRCNWRGRKWSMTRS